MARSSGNPARSAEAERALTNFDCALLVLCAASSHGIAPYEIEQAILAGRGGVLGRSPAHVYKQIKVLAAEGFLAATTDVGKPRPSTVYSVTKRGKSAAIKWVRSSPAVLPATDDSDAFVRLRAARFMRTEEVWESLESLVVEVEFRFQALHREETLLRRAKQFGVIDRLELSLSRRLLGAYEKWLEEVARELGMPNPRGEDENTAAAVRSRRP